jgi:hypothetical protein
MGGLRLIKVLITGKYYRSNKIISASKQGILHYRLKLLEQIGMAAHSFKNYPTFFKFINQ